MAIWSDYLLLFVACVCVTLNFLSTFLFLTSIFYSKRHLHLMTPPSVLQEELPGVSVIKPLMGCDKHLEENLEKYFILKYPKMEILFCVQDSTDPVIFLVKKLQEKYPAVKSKLFIGTQGIKNPLVDNMAPAIQHAQYDLLWICTSRVKGSIDSLLDMVAQIQFPDVGLVHQLPFSSNKKGLPSDVEKVYFGCKAARYYIASHVLGIVCFTGMSYLIKRSNFLPNQGLTWFGQYLAEDYFLSKHLKERGFSMKLSSFPAEQRTEITLNSFLDRMVRWHKLRINMLPFTSGILEPLGNCLAHGILVCYTIYYFFCVNPLAVFICHCLVWSLLDLLQLRIIEGHNGHMTLYRFYKAWIFLELLTVYIYFAALKNISTVKWGKYTFVLSHFGISLQVH